MKKINRLNIVNLILIILVVVLGTLEFTIGLFKIEPKEFCVLIILFAVGVSLLTKGILFKSSNSIWFSLIIFGYTIFLLMSVFYGELRQFYASMFLVLPSILGFLISFIFKEFIYIRISIFLFMISIPVILFNFGLLKIWLFILILAVFGIGGYLLQMLIGTKRGEK